MPTSIDDVLAEMDRRLRRAVAEDDPGGYFLAVYRAVTARVRDGVRAGEFADGNRMERFDVAFAALYLDAATDFARGTPISAAWRVAFEQSQRPSLVLQHVLLGMNAHINLDLGVAAAGTAEPGRIRALEADFDRINGVLAEMIDRMQDAVATVSPWTAVVDRLGGRLDEVLGDRAIRGARERAWTFACELSSSDDPGLLVRERDAAVAALGDRIARPPGPIRMVLEELVAQEQPDVGTVVEALRDRGAPVTD